MNPPKVVPDIVTLGKPMGNGHPLAAVITRPEIAPGVAKRGGYFNNRMRANGVLIGLTGPHGNVLKIRPPMVFTRENADLLVDTLERVLAGL